MQSNKTISQEYVKSLFDYKDGHLYWKVNKTTRNWVGKRVGSPINGYLSVMVDGKNWMCHRLIYLIHHGYMPSKIDHINNNRSDNRIENLRAADDKQNAHNQVLRSNNVSGIKGVSWNNDRQKWAVRVNHNKKTYQRYVQDLELAELVAIEMRSKLHGEYANHGKVA